MRILWVKVGGLWPLNTGGRLRSFHVISKLSQRHAVTLLTTHGPSDDPRGLAAALERCETVSFPYALPKRGSARLAAALVRSWLSPLPVDQWKARVDALAREVRRRIEGGRAEVCVADFLSAVPNVPLGGPTPVIHFSHNVEHMIWRRLAQVEAARWRRTLLGLEWRKMRRFEAAATRRSALTIAVSEVDRDTLRGNASGARVEAIPTGVDADYFKPNGLREKPGRLVFTGSMDYYPNEDAILYFVGEVLPLLRREFPAVTLTVVGRNPSARVRAAAATAGVVVTGTVEDVRPYIDEAAVFVVPLRVGGGTRLKIFEALAMGKAVVSTTIGAEGLPLVSGEHFIQADEPSASSTAIADLLRDPERRRALGEAGRRLVEDRYSWTQVTRQFEHWCEEVVRSHAN